VLSRFVVVRKRISVRANPLQQSDKARHTKHTPQFTLMLNLPSLQKNTTNVVIEQNSRKLLMMNILMSETC